MSIKWNEMPERADVYIEDAKGNWLGWYESVQDMWVNINNPKRFFYKKTLESNTIKVHYPPETKPEWIGGGIPPVGTVCEAYDHEFSEWVEGVVLMHGNSDHAFASGKPDRWKKLFWANKFRPIKSDKEKWVEQASKTFHTGKPFTNCLGAVYDALASGELSVPEVQK